VRALTGLLVALAAAGAVLGPGRASIRPVSPPVTLLARGRVRMWTIRYRAHDGVVRPAFVLLPAWYGPRDDPPLPLIISPHGRGVEALRNTAIWGDLPARGRFAVVNPQGQGRRLELYSWGDPGQIADLAHMPLVLRHALPWLRIDRARIYAFGGSMGGQESLLLAARRPRLLAGAAAFDAPANLALRYRDFLRLRLGRRLRALARIEVGGTPAAVPREYAVRSPIDFARRLAFSGVPLEIWWSRSDRVVVDQRDQSGLLCGEIRKLNPTAPIVEFVGSWAHTAEMRWNRQLPAALRLFHLLPGARHVPGTAGQPVSASRAASTSASVL
jgi:pimeloyl-ACP methyl ester carboxylesterase